MMRVLGIDPGVERTGYAVVEWRDGGPSRVTSGVLVTPQGEPLHTRLALIYSGLSRLIRRHRPDSVASESLFFNLNARTAVAVAKAGGIAALAAARAGLDFREYTAQQVKAAVTGVGNASKGRVAAMVARLLGTAPLPDDEADALAVAVCHLYHMRLEERAAGRQG